jgi:phage/plasmid-associated DNA primase
MDSAIQANELSNYNFSDLGFPDIYINDDSYITLNKKFHFEFFNKERLIDILENESFYKKKMRKSCFSEEDYNPFYNVGIYLKQSKKYSQTLNKIKVNYTRKKGRLFANKSLSLQSLPREVRGTIAGDIYYDIDIKNCHPVIMKFICEKLDICNSYITDYVNDRDGVIELSGDDYEITKIFILKKLNGCSEPCEFENPMFHEWIEGYEEEVKVLTEKLCELYPQLYEEIRKEKIGKGKVWNIKGSIISIIFCSIENYLLHIMVDYFKQCEVIDESSGCVLCFDGIMVLKEKIQTEYELKNHIKNIENIYSSIGIDIKIQEKPMVSMANDQKVRKKVQYQYEYEDMCSDSGSEIDSGSEVDLNEIKAHRERIHEKEKKVKEEEKERRIKKKEEKLAGKKQIEEIESKYSMKSASKAEKISKTSKVGKAGKISKASKVSKVSKVGKKTYHPLTVELISILLNIKNSGLITDKSLADLYAKYAKDNVKIIKKNEGYSWENNKWCNLDHDSMKDLVPELFEIPCCEIMEHIRELISNSSGELEGYYRRIYNNFKKTYQKINSHAGMKNIFNIASSKRKELYCEVDIFDTNPNLIGFNNGVYDLEKDIFRPIKKEDYITMTTGYDYRLPTTEENDMWIDYIEKVMPYSEERDFLLRVLSSCLRGETLENFIMLLGKGRNSKDTLITSNLREVLGDYYRLGSISVLTKELEQNNGSSNTEIANMSKKRVIVYTEPSKYCSLRASNIKKITGSRQITARKLYSSIDNDCYLQGTHILLSQEEATIDNADHAVACRLLKIPFRSQFRTQDVLDKLPENTEHFYLVNSYYKSAEFMNYIKYAFLNNLITSYREFKNDGYIINRIPTSIKNLTKEFLDECDEFKTWFDENYIITKDSSKFLKVKDIYNSYKRSELFFNLSKYNKRKTTYKSFQKTLKSNPELSPFLKDRKVIGKVNYKNILVSYIEIEIDEIDDEEYSN